MRRPLTLKDHHHEQRIFSFRLLVGALLVVALSLVLVGRMVWLQVSQHSRYTTLSDENRVQTQAVPPPRGLITDRNGEILAANRPDFAVELIIEQVPDLEATLTRIGQLVTLEPDDLERFRKRLTSPRRPWDPIPLRGRLGEEEIARLTVNQHRLPGVRVAANPVRHYPHGKLFSHVLGYVNRLSAEDLDAMTLTEQADYAGTHYYGRTGVERYYEHRLHGQVGYRQVETNARGRILRVLEEQPPVPGENLRLTLDMKVQQAAYDALGDRRGAVVAIDPGTAACWRSSAARASSPICSSTASPTRTTPATGKTTTTRCSTAPCKAATRRAPRSSRSSAWPAWTPASPTGSAPSSTPATTSWKATRTATGTGNAGATAGWT